VKNRFGSHFVRTAYPAFVREEVRFGNKKDDWGPFENPNSFHHERGQPLNSPKKLIFEKYNRQVMNRNVVGIRKAERQSSGFGSHHNRDARQVEHSVF
jgi:hypothetical protein